MAVYFLGQFIDIIINSRKSMKISKTVSGTDREIELQGWLILMCRYRDGKPIPVSLEQSLYDHFRYYWATNRLPEITEGDFLDRLPRQLKRTLIIHYMFDDVVHSFRAFFQP